ncbi:branched-chain amino acid transport system permease protein [Marinobacter sp. DSM 26671]|jgi:branched-chain amino acid transport system permease protein|uniref:branched-chain amino acid ABC transporter permease n=1 Tax=Marinobacter sp. DSM 26671 TaxID=1761793 RepID=UPI0008E414F5|nr:branched-chain amino acid ABC transporter permease [Marinobacter sp. DSM 26671]MCP4061967.1 branched-chain amino acid ABC transporter permease [Gammaproteobacteria bacterium]PTB92986.1 branched-chain amino acid ABC transporter permease [Marinobacter sp. B9-2]SFE18356.1 branched-chain amino acid transport system permease protein [Marinobacter sp. DSM 26671]HBX41646.1 branched-chain amino acid ABC transporter permease [Marinobacter adhaerens]|tara:strand:- start:218 stop:1138 length:921 start_codon:yes stop_codon:yes gene_type:complete
MTNRILFIIMLVAGLTAPLYAYPVFVMDLLCFALFACAFNLLLGYAGLLSFGHAAFFGGAAYITGYVTKEWGFTPLLGVLAGAGFALVIGTVFGFLAIRRQGIYFAMVTLALAQIIYFLALQMPFTGGENGLQGIPRGHLFGLIDLNNSLAMYYFVFAIFLIGFGIIYRTINSPFGEVLQAIRENESRALSLGYDVDHFKLLAFVISATLAGLAGATKAIIFQFAALTNAHWQTSGEVILMTLVGGLGTVFGPVLGAITVGALSHELSAFGSWVQVILGTIFVVCVMVFRRGIIGEIQRLASRKQG